jgi:hypothetical protein
LIEIMVVVALLSVIILGLVAMFNQTRRAFTSTMTQVDVLGSGRNAADLIAREMEQITPAGSLNVVNFFMDSPITYTSGGTYLVQPLIDPNDSQTNYIHEVLFLTRNNQQWSFIGYKLLTPATNPSPTLAGIGTLYRFSQNNVGLDNLAALVNTVNYFKTTTYPTTNFNRIMDGVVDFRIRVYDTNGNIFPTYNIVANSPGATTYVTNQTGTISIWTNSVGDFKYCGFSSNAVPAFIEVELGVLEDRALARYQALAQAGVSTVAWNYLQNHAGQVHIFRQRVTVRSVNPAAYQ